MLKKKDLNRQHSELYFRSAESAELSNQIGFSDKNMMIALTAATFSAKLDVHVPSTFLALPP